MIRIDPLAPQPSTLVEAQRLRRASSASSGRAYDNLTTAVKDDVRAHLFREQQGRCAYCERTLEADFLHTVIEHFHPRNETPVREWSRACRDRIGVEKRNWDLVEISIGNLLLCCEGKGESGKGNFTCDASKKNTHVCDEFYNPKGASSDSLVCVSPDGKVRASFFPGAEVAVAQKHLDETFGLNRPRLVEQRRALYAAQLRAFNAVKARKGGRVAAVTLRGEAALKLRERAKTDAFGSTLLSVAIAISGVS